MIITEFDVAAPADEEGGASNIFFFDFVDWRDMTGVDDVAVVGMAVDLIFFASDR